MSHQDRREPLPAEYQYQPWHHDGRVLKQGEEMLAIWAEYRTLEEALAGMSAVKAQLTADAAAKGLALAGHGPYPGGAYSCRIEDGVRLAVVDGPIEKGNYVAHASAFYVPKVTHGVDCDCPPCRMRYWGGYMNAEAYRQDQLVRLAAESAVKHLGAGGVEALLDALGARTQTAYGWDV